MKEKTDQIRALLDQIDAANESVPAPSQAPVPEETFTSSLDDLIAGIIKVEGGYVDDPNDPGGATKYGITIATLKAWRKEPVTKQDVMDLTVEEAEDIYFFEYVAKPKFNQLNSLIVRDLLVDSGVQHGPGNAVKFLQRAAGSPADGIIGPATLRAANAVPEFHLFLKVLAARQRFYGNICSNRPKSRKFSGGWFNRMAHVTAAPTK